VGYLCVRWYWQSFDENKAPYLARNSTKIPCSLPDCLAGCLVSVGECFHHAEKHEKNTFSPMGMVLKMQQIA